MPQVDTKHYFRKKYDTLERFISYFYQIDLLTGVVTDANAKILEIGKGSGVFSDHIKKTGLQITTVDIDGSLKPDYTADVRKLPFQDNAFDAVVAYEILEHLPFEDFEKALQELKRVSKKHVLISLPYRSSGFEFILKLPFIRTLFKKPFLDFFVRWPLRFGGIKTSGQHYWEMDSWKYSFGKVKNILTKTFKITKTFRPPLNYYHYFFVLEKK